MLLDEFKVLMRPVALSHCPACASGKHGIHLISIQVHRPSTPDPGRNAMKQGLGQLFLHWMKIFDRESRIPFDEIARRLWSHMLDDLCTGLPVE